MPEKELMHWIMTVLFPVFISAAGFFSVTKAHTASLEHRLTELEAMERSQEKMIDMHTVRLDKHDEDHKMQLGMIEQIKNLSENVNELKSDLKEIKSRL
ncbi:hypothetical protein DDV21_010180 [Streptococcus chenjunshii]|uniref:DUF7365 domain-containing protein n=1 Tax=Streptococcus chenjunshii TaxID=2173853 RepID=A0A372KLS6_9STRE|nr:hypothetical protein [Streptococcus chenjunshii]AXQ79418.1 hypothetical protein DDV21_010180 [Streptococcus chenjunshii]RFU51125.1 hypothetical protein DDV22_05320 [Streptococcus chenjunshii]RFU53223.1 hypothetical protein DDV23_05830 [Streptococcus chenjunshii]